VRSSCTLHGHQGMAAFRFHLFFLTGACLAPFIHCQVDYHDGPPTSANLSTVWRTSAPAGGYPNQFAAIPLLLHPITTSRPTTPGGQFFAAGFYCVFPCNTFVFGVYAVSTMNQTDANRLYAYTDSMMVVWSANRDHQVQENASLSFAGDGDLILRDADGSRVWSSGTSSSSVVGMRMMESGNLVLFDPKSVPVWQSFDHPVDSLVPGQRLLVGKSLTPSTSSTNTTASIQFHLTVRRDGLYLYAFAGNQVPRLYYSITTDQFMVMSGRHNRLAYVSLRNGSLAGSLSASTTNDCIFFLLPDSQWLQVVRFDSDGHLRLYEWSSQSTWTSRDILDLDECGYPFVCGDYGICSDGQCSCPMPISSASGSYFRFDDRKPNGGCILDDPVSCQQSVEDHQLLVVRNVSNFNYINQNPGVTTDEESCRQACLGNCSCKAALFRHDNGPSNGSCLLASESLSLVGSLTGSAFLKVHTTHSQRRRMKMWYFPPSFNADSASRPATSSADSLITTKSN
jgi:hypothetical protein